MPLRLRSAGGGSVQLNSPVALSTDVAMEVPAYDGAKLLTNKTPGCVLQVQYVASGARVATTHTSWQEPSSAYRVSITPQRSNSVILLQYYIPLNQNSAANILTGVRAFKIVGSGSKSYALTSRGNTNGVRHPIAGGSFRPANGYDNNDMNMQSFTAIDLPGTTDSCVYGFETFPEGTNTTTFGYSTTDSSTWGWDADIVIVATEIAA